MTYFFGPQKDCKADFVISGSNDNIIITSTKTEAKQVIEAGRLLGSRKYNQFAPTITHILQGIPANASVLFTDDGASAINKIVHANYRRYPFV